MMDSIIGTPIYMAPEIELSTEYSKQADIYSLGVVFFFLMRLRIPFKAKTPRELMVEKCKEEFISLPEYYSDELKKLVLFMLRKNY